MEKFISFEKLSKKKQQELNAKKRGSWHGLNPVTRKPANSKAYNRKKARKWSDDSMTVPFAMPAERYSMRSQMIFAVSSESRYNEC